MAVAIKTASSGASLSGGAAADPLQDALGDDLKAPAKSKAAEYDKSESNLPVILDATTCDERLEAGEPGDPRESMTRYNFKRNTWYEFDISVGKLFSGTFRKLQPAVGNRAAFNYRAMTPTYGLKEGAPVDKAGKDYFIADGVSIAGKGSGSFVLQAHPHRAANGATSFVDSRKIRVRAANNGILLVCRLAASMNQQLPQMVAQNASRWDILCKIGTGDDTNDANARHEESYVANGAERYEIDARNTVNTVLAALTNVACPSWLADDSYDLVNGTKGQNAATARATVESYIASAWTHGPGKNTFVQDGTVDISGKFGITGALDLNKLTPSQAKGEIKSAAQAVIATISGKLRSQSFTGPINVDDEAFEKVFIESVKAKIKKAFDVKGSSANIDAQLDAWANKASKKNGNATAPPATPSQQSATRALGSTG